MSRRLILGSMTVRAVLTLGIVFFGYVFLHGWFATFDAWIAQHALDALGFETSTGGSGTLTVSAGGDFDVYAIVTGSCSSAAGALGIAAVSLVLLPGDLRRRVLGCGLGVLTFVVLNIGRICSIIVLGWWLAVGSRPAVIASLLVASCGCLVAAALPRLGLFARLGALLATGIFAALLYDVFRRYDYAQAMMSYHALAGPALTFGGLAVAIALMWRLCCGPVRPPLRALPPEHG
jgi:hypothetical protein